MLVGYGYIQNTALKDSTYLVPVEAEACARDNVMKGRGGVWRMSDVFPGINWPE